MLEPNATLSYREDLNEELAVIRVLPDNPAELSFVPGQYAELSLGHTEPGSTKIARRQYSIASAPDDSRGIEFYIVLVQGGVFTPPLWDLKVGERLWMSTKTKGKFTLDPVPPGKDLVMIATGTGLAPYISMLRTFRSSGRWRRFVVVHGSRYARDLGYRTELETTAAEDPSVFYIPTLTRESEELWTGHRGRVNSIFEDGTYEHVVGAPFAPEECQVFLCGNPDMIDQMEQELVSRSFRLHKKKEPGNIHIERYW